MVYELLNSDLLDRVEMTGEWMRNIGYTGEFGERVEGLFYRYRHRTSAEVGLRRY